MREELDDIHVQQIRADTRRKDAAMLREMGADEICTCGAGHNDVRNHQINCGKTIWETAARTLELMDED